MGNCIDHLFNTTQEKIRVLIFNGGEEEFVASTTVEQITSGPYNGYNLVHHANPYLPLPPDGKLVSGELYYLMPHVNISYSPPVSPKMVGKDGCTSRIKVIVTKQQLEELLRNGEVKEFPYEDYVAGCQKWRPSLAAIPESCIC